MAQYGPFITLEGNKFTFVFTNLTLNLGHD